MKYILLSLINVLVFNTLSYGQDIDTTYFRYDHSVGTKELSNYYEIKSKENDDEYSIEEFFRFTKQPELKASYTEDRQGKKQGAFISYDKKGVVEKQGNYQDDLKEGTWIYYREGKIQRKVVYKKDTLQGKAYYYDEGKELYEWNWKDGESDGYNERIHPNGELYFKGNYIDGELEGLSQYFYDNGQVSSSKNYKNGNLHGTYETFYENGQTYGKGEYVEGNQIGDWTWYRENGKIASKEVYNKKGKIKSFTLYKQNGEAIKSNKKDVFLGVIEEKKKLHKIIVKHVKQNFEFPDRMYRKGFESKVYVSFVINTLGETDKIKMRSEGPDAFEEVAEEIIESVPTQKPAMAHNLLINVSFSIPLTFRIED
ncbi:energy transducer TonB [uncultured Dokdonia sp.]|uniref:energy transducer TonB n=1 Tax=uncultured Dokdonia sp. TaxID=575653 RepID=UPI002634CCB9|nr:energy transducer TonB [uncultured Dokdonia sp.]